MIPDLQRVLEPSYLVGLTDVVIGDLRSMRRECTDLENGLSFVRRLAQGRVDVLSAEAQRRADGGGGDLADLVARLPELLSDGVRAPGSGRVDQELDPPDEVVVPLTDELDKVVGPGIMIEVANLGDDELSAALIAVGNFEERLSTSRRALHSTIDSLNDELAGRIAAGETPTPPA
jgi:anti-sigma-K factor RsiG